MNRYAVAISMPADMIGADALKVDRTHWPNLFGLAEKYEVTISAFRV